MASSPEVREQVQRLLAATAAVTGVDIGVAGKDRVGLLGTGRYRANVGTARPHGSYFHQTIVTGQEFAIFEPRGPGRCRDCEAYRVCPYTLVMSTPVRQNGEVVGVAGILAYDLESRDRVLARREAWAEYLRALALWLAEDAAASILFSEVARAGMEADAIMEAVGDGVIVVGEDGLVRKLNTCAAELVGLPVDAVGRPVTEILPGLKAGRDVPGFREIYRLDGQHVALPTGVTATVRVKPVGGGGRGTCPGAVIGLQPARACFAGVNLAGGDVLGDIIGDSRSMRELKAMICKIAPTAVTVLVTGETGTGKELVARAIHRLSGRRNGPFVAVNCAAIPSEIAESELFGYEAGAFTGARRDGKPGYAELAEGGTLFLDEIGELPPMLQAKLLRFLDTGEVQKVASAKPRRVGARVIAATNCDLRGKVEKGEFRADLYFRLSTLELVLPPLRERREDIPLLVQHFLRAAETRLGKRVEGVDLRAYRILENYSWPGNVRELDHVITRAVLVAQGSVITVEDLPKHMIESAEPPVADREYQLLRQVLATYGDTLQGRLSAARELGISLSTLYRRMRKYGLGPKRSGCHR